MLSVWQAERDGQLKATVKQYLFVLKNKPAHIYTNSGLMLVYWKLHKYSKETVLIKELETETQQQWYIDEHPESKGL